MVSMKSVVREITQKEKAVYDKVVSHIIQSWEWGEFRRKTGVDVVRLGHFDGKKLSSSYQMTFHPVPFSKVTIGYLPKGPMPTKTTVEAIRNVARDKKAAFVKLEPNVIDDKRLTRNDERFAKIGLVRSSKSLFTKYNFLLDLTKDEDQLLAAMHPKTRYNIRLAQKKGVRVYESTRDSDFEIYLKLYFETTRRQKYFGHTPHYHRLMWETLKPAGMTRVLIARYQKPGTRNQVPLVAWMLLNFGDTIYYPYGGSSTEHKEVMASNLVAWEAIRFGKKMKLKTFDMWGALPPQTKESDPWYGFHRFKAGYGGKHIQYVGTYDLVLRPSLYQILNVADKLRWTILQVTR